MKPKKAFKRTMNKALVNAVDLEIISEEFANAAASSIDECFDTIVENNFGGCVPTHFETYLSNSHVFALLYESPKECVVVCFAEWDDDKAEHEPAYSFDEVLNAVGSFAFLFNDDPKSNPFNAGFHGSNVQCLIRDEGDELAAKVETLDERIFLQKAKHEIMLALLEVIRDE